ncbi:acyltransferase family protein [Terriglobus roseus]|uniref:Peptidoglycan/LPS O-acetylase OafA/YrhL, contains acyltransferase and SGNH-hydrolase domains n=1 Tax=Terriglobus roseus TaxID=392734 RepID=A0A1H4J0J8_9BACT|nr:acyltransferase family protein [Terriglobus roseus]SEB39138.1 Peptidoglycan/LPS O-acetylase OafA/YrhL, contains acyltransferase and SGNH-hydrolase domains [Terriglobus roseus]
MLTAMPTPSRAKSSERVYRPDIDGLRAVAVLMVLGAHFRTRFRGGYVGVDIFFVISGYLISGHVISQLEVDSFSIVGFYERRIRRIFPALVVVLIFTTVLAWHYLFPAEFSDYAKSLLAAIFSYSNLLFWKQSGYFDAPSQTKPLLHTWSLGVEEQFYIFLPIFLIAIRRFARQHMRTAIYLVSALTFSLSIYWVRRDATAAFFWAPLRAWELLIGTIISQHYLPVIKDSFARNVASATGLITLLVVALRYTDATSFPGVAALAPCVGTALIISAGETGSSIVSGILSLRPVVFLGTISYSLYLWHWPLLAFNSIGDLVIDGPPWSRSLKSALFALSTAAAVLSWRFVERPFREGCFLSTRKPLFLCTGIAVACFTMAAMAAINSEGAPSRFSRPALDAASYLSTDVEKSFGDECFLGGSDSLIKLNQPICLHASSSGTSYLLYGDSHAAQLWHGLTQIFPDRNISQATAAFCTPYVHQPSGVRLTCVQLSDLIYRDYLPRHPGQTVILSGRWERQDQVAIGDMIDAIHAAGSEVILLGPMIYYTLPLPRLIAESIQRRQPGYVESHRDLEAQVLDQELQHLAQTIWKVHYISFYQDLCTPVCPAYATHDVPMLFDAHHFTPQGSIAFALAMKARNQLL